MYCVSLGQFPAPLCFHSLNLRILASPLPWQDFKHHEKSRKASCRLPSVQDCEPAVLQRSHGRELRLCSRATRLLRPHSLLAVQPKPTGGRHGPGICVDLFLCPHNPECPSKLAPKEKQPPFVVRRHCEFWRISSLSLSILIFTTGTRDFSGMC